MIIRNPPRKVKCPQCGSENVKYKWSLTTIVGWLGRILGVHTVKIWEKKCAECGREFKIFRK
jgi:predicted nucleic-acid-binding Zn-ribbon protein